MAASDKVHIIGIGDEGTEGLTAYAVQLLQRADLVLGTEAMLAIVPGAGKQRHAIGNDPADAVERIEAARGKQIVVLASGDPLFYGIARYLCDRLGKDRFTVVPHVSTMQLAFARVRESWEDAYLTNLASYPLASVLEKVRVADTVGLFTTETVPPGEVARALLDAKIDYFTAYVCENLGSPDERVTHGELSDIAGEKFGLLNVMILIRKPEIPDRPVDQGGKRLFGNPDEMFLQTRPKQGLITPAEVRSIALAQLDLGPASIAWDIGAGSGSVAIEMAQITSEGKVYAIEMDPADQPVIVNNAERFKVKNLVPVMGRAPDVWVNLPDPDCIFIGGNGREIARLVDLAYDRLRAGGRLVCNVGSIENLSTVHELLQRRTADVRVWMINIARGTYQLERVRFAPLPPTFLLAVVKPKP